MNKPKTDCSCNETEFAYSFKFRKTDSNFNDLWAMKSSARESLRDWLIAWIFTPKTADICANACSEMIENCIKFSIVDTLSSVSIKIQDSRTVIETENQSEKGHGDTLRQMLASIESNGDPRALFAEKLLKSSKGKSQLGILKIMMETRGTFSCVDQQDDSSVRIRLEISSGNLS